MPARLPMSRQVERRRVHRSKQEISKRISTEAKTVIDQNRINAPGYLDFPSEQEEFVRLAEQLADRGMYDAALDADTLARYVQSHRRYIDYTDRLNVAIQNNADLGEITRWQRLQDTAFRQCRACAADLGLTVTTRAKLSIPPRNEDEDLEL